MGFDTNGNGLDVSWGNKKLHATGLVAVLVLFFSLTLGYLYANARDSRYEHTSIRAAMDRMTCIFTLDQTERNLIRTTPAKLIDYCPWMETK